MKRNGVWVITDPFSHADEFHRTKHQGLKRMRRNAYRHKDRAEQHNQFVAGGATPKPNQKKEMEFFL